MGRIFLNGFFDGRREQLPEAEMKTPGKAGCSVFQNRMRFGEGETPMPPFRGAASCPRFAKCGQSGCCCPGKGEIEMKKPRKPDSETVQAKITGEVRFECYLF